MTLSSSYRSGSRHQNRCETYRKGRWRQVNVTSRWGRRRGRDYGRRETVTTLHTPVLETSAVGPEGLCETGETDGGGEGTKARAIIAPNKQSKHHRERRGQSSPAKEVILGRSNVVSTEHIGAEDRRECREGSVPSHEGTPRTEQDACMWSLEGRITSTQSEEPRQVTDDGGWIEPTKRQVRTKGRPVQDR